MTIENIRTCTKCKLAKQFCEFHKDSSRKYGISYICKECYSEKDRKTYCSNLEKNKKRGIAFYWSNPEKQKKLRRERYAKNPEQYIAYIKEYSLKNWDKIKKTRRVRYEKTKFEVMAYNALRRADKIKATPSWLNNEHKKQIRDMYKQAAKMTVSTGVVHHIDHIFPLRGKGFNGLHVPWNLRIVTKLENLKKTNKFPEEFSHMKWGN